MAVEVMQAVWQMAPDAIPSTDRLVLLALGDHASPDGTKAYPSIATICRRTSLTRRAVQYSLAILKLAGLIREELVPGRTTRYTVCLEAVRAGRGQGRTTCTGARRAQRTGCTGERNTQEGRTACAAGAHDVREGGALSAPDPSEIRPEPSVNTAAQQNLLRTLVHEELGQKFDLNDRERRATMLRLMSRVKAEAIDVVSEQQVSRALDGALAARHRVHSERRALVVAR